VYLTFVINIFRIYMPAFNARIKPLYNSFALHQNASVIRYFIYIYIYIYIYIHMYTVLYYFYSVKNKSNEYDKIFIMLG